MSMPWPDALRGPSILRGCLGMLLALAAAGCALFTCRPATVVVAEKEERLDPRLVPAGLRTTETGKLEEVEKLRQVRTYRIRSQDGDWYQVSADAFKGAKVGSPIEVCR